MAIRTMEGEEEVVGLTMIMIKKGRWPFAGAAVKVKAAGGITRAKRPL